MKEGEPRLLICEPKIRVITPRYRTWSTHITDNLIPSVTALAVLGVGTGVAYGLGQEIMVSGVSQHLILTAYKYGTIGLGAAGAIAAGMILVGVKLEEPGD